MVPQKLSDELSEFRLDLAQAPQGKIRSGLTIVVSTVAVVASGWPPGDPIQRALFLVPGAIPALGIGLGLVAGALIQMVRRRSGYASFRTGHLGLR